MFLAAPWLDHPNEGMSQLAENDFGQQGMCPQASLENTFPSILVIWPIRCLCGLKIRLHNTVSPLAQKRPQIAELTRLCRIASRSNTDVRVEEHRELDAAHGLKRGQGMHVVNKCSFHCLFGGRKKIDV